MECNGRIKFALLTNHKLFAYMLHNVCLFRSPTKRLYIGADSSSIIYIISQEKYIEFSYYHHSLHRFVCVQNTQYTYVLIKIKY